MTSPTELKQASQAKLINNLLAACQQATACTAIEVLGALECVKADISTRMVLSRPPVASPSVVTPEQAAKASN